MSKTPKKIGLLKPAQLLTLEEKIKTIEEKISEEKKKRNIIISEKNKLFDKLATTVHSDAKKKEIIEKIDKLDNELTKNYKTVDESIKEIKPYYEKIIAFEQSISDRSKKLKTEIEIERSMNKIPTLKAQLAQLETRKTKKGGKCKKHKKTIHKKAKKHKKTKKV